MKKRIFTLLIFAAVLCCCVICISACKPAYTGLDARYDGGEVQVGATLDRSLITVTARYGDCTERRVDSYELSYDFSTVGDKTVIVKYTENGVMRSASFKVTVVAAKPDPEPDTPALTSITAVYNGGNIYVGGVLNNYDVTVTAFYDDGSNKTVTGFSVGNFSSAAAGECVVNVSYCENGITKETTFTVNIVARATEAADYGDYGLLQNDGSVKIINTAAVGGELQIHFIAFENVTPGDCVYIKAGETDILIDAGSTTTSSSTIDKYIAKFVDDNKLEYVIATHADSDHISGFVGNGSNGILDKYDCETIITYTASNKTTAVKNNFEAKCKQQVDNKNAKLYTALQCYKETDGAKRIYKVSDNVEMEILYHKYYEKLSSDENNQSVCLMFHQYGEGYDFNNKNNPNNKNFVNHFLFTGDLEKEGEKSLVESNPNLPEVVLFKGGHHGSATSSSTELLSMIKPKLVCVCTCCDDSTTYKFPRQEFINRVAEYTDMLFLTNTRNGSSTDYVHLNGNISVTSTVKGVFVNCSNNNTLFKDTDWFKQNRTCPPKWKNETEQSITA